MVKPDHRGSHYLYGSSLPEARRPARPRLNVSHPAVAGSRPGGTVHYGRHCHTGWRLLWRLTPACVVVGPMCGTRPAAALFESPRATPCRHLSWKQTTAAGITLGVVARSTRRPSAALSLPSSAGGRGRAPAISSSIRNRWPSRVFPVGVRALRDFVKRLPKIVGWRSRASPNLA
jgi:hypothetical protein